MLIDEVPISIAAIPVGAAKRTLGLLGLSPFFRNILSATCDVTSMANDFPTPPPPRKYGSYYKEM